MASRSIKDTPFLKIEARKKWSPKGRRFLDCEENASPTRRTLGIHCLYKTPKGVRVREAGAAAPVHANLSAGRVRDPIMQRPEEDLLITKDIHIKTNGGSIISVKNPTDVIANTVLVAPNEGGGRMHTRLLKNGKSSRIFRHTRPRKANLLCESKTRFPRGRLLRCLGLFLPIPSSSIERNKPEGNRPKQPHPKERFANPPFLDDRLPRNEIGTRRVFLELERTTLLPFRYTETW